MRKRGAVKRSTKRKSVPKKVVRKTKKKVVSKIKKKVVKSKKTIKKKSKKIVRKIRKKKPVTFEDDSYFTEFTELYAKWKKEHRKEEYPDLGEIYGVKKHRNIVRKGFIPIQSLFSRLKRQKR